MMGDGGLWVGEKRLGGGVLVLMIPYLFVVFGSVLS